jgi:hypothetical protein
MLDLYEFHTAPESLDQRIVVHQNLNPVYDFIKDMFNIFYAGKQFKLEWKHDVVSNVEQYIELTMELNGSYRHGMIRLYYENHKAFVKTSIRAEMVSQCAAYEGKQVDAEEVFDVVDKFIQTLENE